MADKERRYSGPGKSTRPASRGKMTTDTTTGRSQDLITRIPKSNPRLSGIFTSESVPDWAQAALYGPMPTSSNTTPLMSPQESPRKLKAMKLKMLLNEQPTVKTGNSMPERSQVPSSSNSSFKDFMKPSAQLLLASNSSTAKKSRAVPSGYHSGNGASGGERFRFSERIMSSDSDLYHGMASDGPSSHTEGRRLQFVSPHSRNRKSSSADESFARMPLNDDAETRRKNAAKLDAITQKFAAVDLDSTESHTQSKNLYSNSRPELPRHRNSSRDELGRMELTERHNEQRIRNNLKERVVSPRLRPEHVDSDEEDITGEQFEAVNMERYYEQRSKLLLEEDGLLPERIREELALKDKLDVTRAWVVGNLTMRGKNGVIAGIDSEDSRDDSWLTEEEQTAGDVMNLTSRETESTSSPASRNKVAQERETAVEEDEEDLVNVLPVRDKTPKGTSTLLSTRLAAKQRHTSDSEGVQAVYSSTHRHDRPSPSSGAAVPAADGSERPRSARQAVRPQRPTPDSEAPPTELIPARSRRSVAPQPEERGSGRAGLGRRVFPEETEISPVVKQLRRKTQGVSEGASATAAPEPATVKAGEEQQDSASSTPGRRSGSFMSALGFGRSRTVLQKPFADVRAQFALREQELGRGRFGVIRVCEDKLTGRKLACKSISKKRLKTAQDIEDVRREVAVMEMLKTHPDVAHLEDTFEDEHNVHLVMELCEGGELFDRIKARKYYSERDAALVTRTVAEVLLHCHSLGIIHRDLKPENILLCSKTSDVKVKVIDYGVAAMVKKGQQCRDMAGSPFYLAPEVLGDRCRYGAAVDVWSAGVVLYILLCGVPPFWAEDNSGIFAAIKTGRINLSRRPWPSISEEAKDLVKRMLTIDPNQRITPQQILGHPFIANLEEDYRASRGIR